MSGKSNDTMQPWQDGVPLIGTSRASGEHGGARRHDDTQTRDVQQDGGAGDGHFEAPVPSTSDRREQTRASLHAQRQNDRALHALRRGGPRPRFARAGRRRAPDRPGAERHDDPGGARRIQAVEAWTELLVTVRSAERALPSDMHELLNERFQ